ncbi:hypothetical protein LLB_3704 [Legionella longbeachae D-4968]|nr:hypothetical protein LLB_3704 [Legionella longbeachae D-4968]
MGQGPIYCSKIAKKHPKRKKINCFQCSVLKDLLCYIAHQQGELSSQKCSMFVIYWFNFLEQGPDLKKIYYH